MRGSGTELAVEQFLSPNPLVVIFEVDYGATSVSFSRLSQQFLNDSCPFRIQRLPAHGLASPAIPIRCVADRLPYGAGTHAPTNPLSPSCWADSCALCQSPFPSHHNPASGSLNPAGGAVAVRDWRNSSTVNIVQTAFPVSIVSLADRTRTPRLTKHGGKIAGRWFLCAGG